VATRRCGDAPPEVVTARVGGYAELMTDLDEVLKIDEPASAADAVRVAEEAMRTAVHSTDASTGWPGITGAADVYAMLGALGYTFELLPQLLDQLTEWLDAHAAVLHADGAHVDGAHGVGDGGPRDRLAKLRTDLAAALAAVGEGRGRLASAQAELAPVSGPLADPTDRAS